MPTRIAFAQSQPFCQGFAALVEQQIVSRGARRIADLGGGANPVLSAGFCRRYGLSYTIVDVSEAEMVKATHCAWAQRVQADLGATAFAWDQPRFDLVCSRFVAEHVPDGRQFHRNVLTMLGPGGLALHCFPTLYSTPFVVNRLLRQGWSSWLLDRLQPRDRYQHDKFPAHYAWCRGPSRRQCARLEELGYEILEYQGYFGHPYFEALPWLHGWHRRLSAWLVNHPCPLLTSYAYLLMARAAAADRSLRLTKGA